MEEEALPDSLAAPQHLRGLLRRLLLLPLKLKQWWRQRRPSCIDDTEEEEAMPESGVHDSGEDAASNYSGKMKTRLAEKLLFFPKADIHIAPLLHPKSTSADEALYLILCSWMGRVRKSRSSWTDIKTDMIATVKGVEFVVVAFPRHRTRHLQK